MSVVALRLLVPLLFLSTQLIIVWYGDHTGKLPTKGSLFGWHYDSLLISSFVTQLKFIWLLILVNLLFTMAFHWGFKGFQSFLIVAVIWLVSGPTAALILNTFRTKEPIDLPTIIGVVLIAIGSICVIAHKDIAAIVK